MWFLWLKLGNALFWETGEELDSLPELTMKTAIINRSAKRTNFTHFYRVGTNDSDSADSGKFYQQVSIFGLLKLIKLIKLFYCYQMVN